jgi:hypothetical protein
MLLPLYRRHLMGDHFLRADDIERMRGALGGVPRWKLYIYPVVIMPSASLFVKLTENIPSMGLLLLVGLRAAPAWVECNERDFDNRQRCANDVDGRRRSLARNPTGRS